MHQKLRARLDLLAKGGITLREIVEGRLDWEAKRYGPDGPSAQAKTLVVNGRWNVPVDQRPANWQSMGIAE